MLNIASGVLTLLGYIPYIIAIVRGKTIPNSVSWWIWSGVGTILLSTYYSLGGQAALGLAIGALSGQLLVALLTLKYGTGKITAFDGICIAGAITATILWWLSASPFLPHILILIIDLFAWLPTFRKTVKQPGSEDLLSWMFWTAGAALALFNSTNGAFTDLLYPVYVTVTDAIIVVTGLLLYRRVRSHITAQ